MEGVKNYALYVIYTSVQTMEGVKNFMIHVFTLVRKKLLLCEKRHHTFVKTMESVNKVLPEIIGVEGKMNYK